MAHKLVVNYGGQTFTERKGLEGPFQYANGQVLYYDPKEGQYWDPLTDFYVPKENMDFLHSLTWSQLQ